MSNRLRTIIIIVVSTVWAANFLAPLFIRGYTPAPELNVAFMAILGVLTASYNKDQDEDERPKKVKRALEESEQDEKES